MEETHKQVVQKVERVLTESGNRYGFHIAPGGVYCRDNRWWVVLEPERPPTHMADIWTEIGQLEDRVDSEDLRILLTSA